LLDVEKTEGKILLYLSFVKPEAIKAVLEYIDNY